MEDQYGTIGLFILAFLCIVAMWYKINVAEVVDEEQERPGSDTSETD